MPLPMELRLLACSVILLIVHVVVQARTKVSERGLAWNAGPRDDIRPPEGKFAGRAERALRNFSETYTAFVALALALVVADRTGGWGEAGAWLWLGARVAYLPLYVFGVPWVRSAAFALSVVGLLTMVVALW